MDATAAVLARPDEGQTVLVLVEQIVQVMEVSEGEQNERLRGQTVLEK